MFRKNLAIMWFRNDMRLEDNSAFFAAMTSDYEIIPIYIIEEEDMISEDSGIGSYSKVWLYHALKKLNSDLDGCLQIFFGNSGKILNSIFSKFEYSALFYNKCYEPWFLENDKRINDTLDASVKVFSYNSSLLIEPWKIKKQDSSFYKIFTPFYKKNYLDVTFDEPLPLPCKDKIVFNRLEGCIDIDSVEFFNCDDLDAILEWKVGEDAAKELLNSFMQNSLKNYDRYRDFPSEDGVSKLAPYIHFGHLSPRYIWYKVHKCPEKNPFLRQLVWREFAYYILYHNPKMKEKCIQSNYEQFPWGYDKQLLESWQQGMTGYPIVDAGMRELLHTGYMHNRVRMIVGSFLVKNLNIHWTFGEKWFWDHLFDADLANNSFGWQWIAGCGSDAAPYFRIFNPTLQGQKFDPNGEYIKRYVPELKNVPVKYLFEPWTAPSYVLEFANVVLGKNYPMPIVDLKKSRIEVLEIYKFFLRSNKKK